MSEAQGARFDGVQIAIYPISHPTNGLMKLESFFHDRELGENANCWMD
jgi:hypothetical protein